MVGFHDQLESNIEPWWTFDPNSFINSLDDSVSKGLQHQALEYGLQYHKLSDVVGRFIQKEKPDVFFQELITATKGKIIRGYFQESLKGTMPREIFETGAWGHWIMWDRGAIEIYLRNDDSVSVSLFTTDEEAYDRCQDIFKKKLWIQPPKGEVQTLYQSSPQKPIRSRHLGVVTMPLERGNYSPAALDGYDRIIADLKRHEPLGRLSIITGTPGTGKTYLLRALITEVNALFLLVPPKFIPRLGDPEIMNCFLDIKEEDTRPLVLLLEDADAILSRRVDTNMDGIMSTLNLGDGLIGDMLNARLVATSNVLIDEVDSALTRPGRLSVRIDVGALETEHAGQVLKRLMPETEHVFDEPITLAEVYGTARSLGWQPPNLEGQSGATDPSIRVMRRRIFNSEYEI